MPITNYTMKENFEHWKKGERVKTKDEDSYLNFIIHDYRVGVKVEKGNLYFCLEDLQNILKIKKRKANKLLSDARAYTLTDNCYNKYIDERGLFELIFSSNKEINNIFKEWAFDGLLKVREMISSRNEEQ